MICTEGQPFGENYNPTYKAGGLTGHSGEDCSCGFGTPIYSLYDGLVYKVLSKDHPSATDGFTGVFMIVDDGKESFEWLVGHCDPSVVVGTQVKKGDLIGTEANHGTVYSGNIQITVAMQKAGDQRGAHRHYQKRPILFSPIISAGYTYLDTLENTYFQDARGYCQVINYNNGFNGCIDPSKPVFTRDLWVGSQGYDVYVLQRILGNLGYLKVPATAYFGSLTLNAVSQYQKANGISPIMGYVGVKTKASLSPQVAPPPFLLGE